MKRLAVLFLVGCWTALTFGQTLAADRPVGKKPSGKQPAKGKAAVSPPNSAVKMLSARLERVEFEDTPLSEAFKELARMTDTNIVVFWGRLQDEDIQRDTPISFSVRDMPLGRVLWLILHQASRNTELAYSADDDLILISTKEDLGSKMVARVYNVEKLIQTRPCFKLLGDSFEGFGLSLLPMDEINESETPDRSLLGNRRNGHREDRGDDGGIRPQGTYDAKQKDPERIMLDLIDVITNAIEPESWAVNGGMGTITPFRGKLIIRNSLLVHQQIGGALAAPTSP